MRERGKQNSEFIFFEEKEGRLAVKCHLSLTILKYSKYGHMFLHAEPPTCVSLQVGTHTGLLVTQRQHLSSEWKNPEIVVRDPMWASHSLPPLARVQPAAGFFIQALPPDRPSHLRSSLATSACFLASLILFALCDLP